MQQIYNLNIHKDSSLTISEVRKIERQMREDGAKIKEISEHLNNVGAMVEARGGGSRPFRPWDCTSVRYYGKPRGKIGTGQSKRKRRTKAEIAAANAASAQMSAAKKADRRAFEKIVMVLSSNIEEDLQAEIVKILAEQL